MKHTLHTKTSAIWSMKNHHSRRKPHLRRVVSDNAPLPKIHLTIRQLKSCSNPASQSSSLEFIKPEKNIYKPHFSIFWSFPTVDLRLVFIYLKNAIWKRLQTRSLQMSKKSAPENSYPKVSEFLVTASENETVPDGILQPFRGVPSWKGLQW